VLARARRLDRPDRGRTIAAVVLARAVISRTLEARHALIAPSSSDGTVILVSHPAAAPAA